MLSGIPLTLQITKKSILNLSSSIAVNVETKVVCVAMTSLSMLLIIEELTWVWCL